MGGDVRQGAVKREDKVGNAMADFLAVRGAELHPSAIHLAQHQEERVAFAKELQRMYLNILIEQQQDTADIEEAMPNPGGGRFVRQLRAAKSRRRDQVAVSSSHPGSKRRRTLVPAPGAPSLDFVDVAMQT